MEFTKLSLVHGGGSGGGSESEGLASPSLKRKWSVERVDTTTIDLQLKQPLPSDWEQCLDLQSGRMYYVNRETSRKSWNRPDDVHEQTWLGLELKMMSTGCTSSSSERNQQSESDMVALACSNCHLLVMISASSPSCPNCKYVHSLKSKHPVDGRSF